MLRGSDLKKVHYLLAGAFCYFLLLFFLGGGGVGGGRVSGVSIMVQYLHD